MTAELFKQISAQLLKNCYGLELADIGFDDDARIAMFVRAGLRPYMVVSEEAEDCDLHRIDLVGWWGIPSKAPLTAKDENLAFAVLQRNSKRADP
ncbi:MAG: hypothetical protein V4463_07670 [Pseudomonadota bacterium]